MCCQPIPGQLQQVLTRFRVKKTGTNHGRTGIALGLIRKHYFRFPGESGYILKRRAPPLGSSGVQQATTQPPAPSWGSMLNSAQRFLDNAPWLAIAPGAAIFVVVLAFNLMGDGLRDALDPRADRR